MHIQAARHVLRDKMNYEKYPTKTHWRVRAIKKTDGLADSELIQNILPIKGEVRSYDIPTFDLISVEENTENEAFPLSGPVSISNAGDVFSLIVQMANEYTILNMLTDQLELLISLKKLSKHVA
ncbi:hypothetical protein RF11_06341 [Thelohanellus kitauei]|uniref:Uncharacterized protein n=1 Tax=Thelohanellus kitauei TaxID=669202 RepID=A0A0C2N1H9_THEKT|nr:hypothetical protein RF11_06341 [Thelohanellus kitauei]